MAVVIWANMKVENKPESCCHFFPYLDCEKSLFFSRRSSPGARFSKVPIINVPAKLLLFFKQDRGFNSLAFNISHQLGKQNAVVC